MKRFFAAGIQLEVKNPENKPVKEQGGVITPLAEEGAAQTPWAIGMRLP